MYPEPTATPRGGIDMKRIHENHKSRRKLWYLGVCGEEWVAVFCLLVAVVGVLVERAAYLQGSVGI